MTREDWTGTVDQSHGVDIAYLKLSKAVTHQRLLQKLAGYRFSGQMFCRLKRCYRRISPWSTIIYVDIPNIAQTDSSFFADDSKIYTIIKTLEYSHKLQTVFKTSVMCSPEISHKTYSVAMLEYPTCMTLHFSRFSLTMRRILEVWISSDLKLSMHCTKAEFFASLKDHLLTPQNGYLFFYTRHTCVKLHSEYCASIWSLSLAKEIDILEKVQKRATRKVR